MKTFEEVKKEIITGALKHIINGLTAQEYFEEYSGYYDGAFKDIERVFPEEYKIFSRDELNELGDIYMNQVDEMAESKDDWLKR